MKEFSLAEHRDEVLQLLTYVPWLTKKAGEKASKVYNDNNLSKSTIPFPVYDTMLLNFVNEAGKTGLIDKNYVYAYSEHRIRTVQDEKRIIEEVGVKEAGILVAILSKYVLGGMTKGVLWSQAVEEGVFLAVLLRMKKLLEIWDSPLA